MVMTKKIALLLVLCVSVNTSAGISVHDFDSPQQEAQYNGLINELRCPTCQNQNLAGSDAPIAQDLKQQTYEMVKAGRSDSEIRAFMFERYGDFISYKPPVRPSTWILWFFPPILLIVAVIGWLIKASKKRQPYLSSQSLTDSETAELSQLLVMHPKRPNQQQSTKTINHTDVAKSDNVETML